MRCLRRGAADPRILSGIIIAAGFIGLVAYYFLEPYLLPAPPAEETQGGPVEEPTIPLEDVKRVFGTARLEIARLLEGSSFAQSAFAGGVDALAAELAPTGDGFACSRIDAAKFALQDRLPALTQLREWLARNARHHNQPAMRGQLVRLQQELDALVKAMERAVTGFQAMNGALTPKAAENALRKLEPLWKSYWSLLERTRTFLDGAKIQ